MSNFKFGDKYIKAMSEGIKKLPNVSVFRLAGNRITENGANTLLEQITKHGKIIDVQNNSIGKLGSEHIAKCLNSNDCWLEELNLEDNKLGDSSVNMIL